MILTGNEILVRWWITHPTSLANFLLRSLIWWQGTGIITSIRTKAVALFTVSSSLVRLCLSAVLLLNTQTSSTILYSKYRTLKSSELWHHFRFQTFAVFWMLYFLGGDSSGLSFMFRSFGTFCPDVSEHSVPTFRNILSRRFGTFCPIFIGCAIHWDGIECSETSTHKI